MWVRFKNDDLEFSGSNPPFRCIGGEISRDLKYDQWWKLITIQTDDEMLKCRDQKGFDTLVVYTLTYECLA